MAAVSGLCPQRRVTKDTELEVLIVGGNSNTKGDNGGAAYLGNLESFKDSAIRHNRWFSPSTVFRVLLTIIVSALIITGIVNYGVAPLLRQANHLGRQCMNIRDGSRNPTTKYNFAIVTCSDGSRKIPHRSFEGLMDLVEPNKQKYVDRHGYHFIDASDLLDKSRPPSWSKILAVKEHLSNYDYIFWNDVDSVVTTPSTTLDSIIHSIAGDAPWDEMPDLILTEDASGVNAGMFFVRNSEWSRKFLDLWWSQTSFVKPFGLSKSGDNDALKFLISTMPEAEKKRHVLIPQMQCVFNSMLWTPSWKNTVRLMTETRTIWRGAFAKGDFMIHLAGLNDKKKWVHKVLEDINEDDDTDTSNTAADEIGQFLARKAGPSRRP